MSKFCIDVPVVDYIIIYHCKTKQRTNATYSFKRYIADNKTAIQFNKASEKAESRFLTLANKCGWIIETEIKKVEEDV